MYCIITTCSVECYWQYSDGTVLYKYDKTVNFCGFRRATTSPITVFINFVFLHLYLLFFIPIYAEIWCLQHSITYHGRVIMKTFFINVIITAVLQFTK